MSSAETDPARYTPIGPTDYLYVIGIIGSVTMILIITLVHQLRHPNEDLEKSTDSDIMRAQNYENFRFYSAKEEVVAILGLGKGDSNSTRAAVAKAIESLKKLDDKQVTVEIHSEINIKEIAEGAALGSYSFQKKDVGSLSGELDEDSAYTFTGDKSRIKVIIDSDHNFESWREGLIFASAQNLARSLTEMPANKLTPMEFCKVATKLFEDKSEVSIHEYDQDWIKSQKMGAFLSVTKGSNQPCRFLELKYNGSPKTTPSTVLIGKGVTFDAGGISIKPSADMALMKGDMGGAAVTLSAFKAAVDLKIPINLVALMPLTENLINGHATKPGDVITASNGKTIEVDNTDAEGRLLLADAIYYASKKYNPNCIVELSTLTGAMDIALGYPYAGTFTKNDKLWTFLEAASHTTNDLLWRMPLHKEYLDQMKSAVADYKNVGGRSGGSCTAAAFLQEFASFSEANTVTTVPFAHIDIAGVFHKRSGKDFLCNGMTGRPTRTIIEFLRNLSQETDSRFL